ncbi:MAG: AAA family ATPase [Cloacibacterium sp.]|nr:AAA family ATPase [Cloacibacterium sp.]
MIITLVGYMGTGKSHISNILSSKLNFKLFDLDQEISNKFELSIAEIFKNHGEIFFRKAEKETLNEILSSEEHLILSVGGGTPVYYDNMERINDKSISIYLRTGVSTLTERLKKNKHKRPLIAKIADEDLPEFIAKHLFERNSFYSKAHYIVDTDQKTTEEVAEEIIQIALRHQ